MSDKPQTQDPQIISRENSPYLHCAGNGNFANMKSTCLALSQINLGGNSHDRLNYFAHLNWQVPLSK